MEESKKDKQMESGDKEIIYSKAIKAGKRIYYLDVKRNLKDELFLAVTESKKVASRDGSQVSFEKHKIFLYKEDFNKFVEGMNDVIDYIRQHEFSHGQHPEASSDENDNESLDHSDDIKLNIDF
ncbi:MAG: DUF3276 family protein [Parabacteroides sp.]|nr:DUF3276 family protein [Parabacteroides sp.]